MLIRKATAEDFDQAIEILDPIRMVYASYKKFKEDIEKDINEKRLYLAVLDKVVGGMTLNISKPDSEIYRLAVVDKFRHEGIGKKLVNRAIALASAYNSRYLKVESATIFNAFQFYNRLGFDVENLNDPENISNYRFVMNLGNNLSSYTP